MLPEDTATNPVAGCFLGADVAKDTVVFFVSRTATVHTVANKPAALRRFLEAHTDHALVVEATGGYECDVLAEAGRLAMVSYRVNPYRVRAFMRAAGQNAKTDAIDARALAGYAALHGASLRRFIRPSKAEHALRQLTRRRDELIAMRTQERNRLQAPDNAALRRSLRVVLRCLDGQIAGIEIGIARLIAADPDTAAKVAVMTAVKGIGQVTAANLLAALPELGSLDRKQIASLGGLAPFARDSGQRSAYRRTGTGRRDVRRILFMASFAAARFNPVLKPFYARLRANGKKPLQALIATARKLLVILNAKLRDAFSTPLPQQS